MASPFRLLHAKWRKFWSQHWPRQTFVIVGTIAGVGTFYWPFIKSILDPMQSIPPEERHLYDVENTYYVQKRREKATQRKKEAEERQINMQREKEAEERQDNSR